MKAMRLVQWGPALLVVLNVAGCAVGRQEVPPITELPQHFSASGPEVLPERWWRSFEDRALENLVAEGLTGNPNLQTYWNRLDQARALARRAGASEWPQADIEGSATRSGRWPEDGKDIHSTDYTAGGRVSYELDLWGRIRSAEDAAVLDAEAGREDLRAAALTLSGQIASNWYQLAEAKGQVEILREQAGINEQVLELVTLGFRRGQVGAADVLRQRQLVESNRGDLQLAEARVEVLRHQLAVLVGRPPQNPVDDSGARLTEPPRLPETGIPAELLRQRPDLRSAQLDVAAANARLGQAVAERYPRITLTGSVGTTGPEPSALFSDWLGTLAGNLAAPLLDGGSRSAEVDRTEAAAEEALNRYRQAILTSLQEVEDALVSEARQQNYTESLTAQLNLANDVLERTRDAYLGGQVDYLRVLEAITSQQTLQRRLLTARREVIQYRIDLCRALGGRWTPERPAEGVSTVEGRKES